MIPCLTAIPTMNGDSEVYRDTDAFLEKDSQVDNDTENLGSARITQQQPKRNLQSLLFLLHLLLLLLYTCIFYFSYQGLRAQDGSRYGLISCKTHLLASLSCTHKL